MTGLARTFRINTRRRSLIAGKCLSVFAVLLTLESVSHLYLADRPRILISDPLLGNRLTPGFNRVLWNAESKRHVHLRTNSLGFRGPEWNPIRSDNTVRIAVLGDSYVEGLSVAEEETFCHQLRLRLRRLNPAINWQVMNFGVSGSATGDALVRYRDVVRRFEPDIVLLCVVANDVVQNNPELAHSPMPRFRVSTEGELEFVAGEKTPRLIRSLSLSRFASWQKQRLVRTWKHLRANPNRPRISDRLVLPNPRPPIERAWQITTALIQEFDRVVAANGGKLIVASLPTAWQTNPHVVAEVQTRLALHHRIEPLLPEKRLGNCCRETGVLFLPLATQTADLFREGNSRPLEFFHAGRGHYTPLGHSHIADWLADTINAIPDADQSRVQSPK